jgi:integrase
MSDKIDTVTARAKLQSRREPYWHKISQGCFLGFRKMTADPSGVWQVRYRKDSGGQLTRTLGKLDHYAGFERFDRAVTLAQEWLKHVRAGGATDAITVIDACNAYAEKIRTLKGDAAAKDLEGRYLRWVKPDPIHKIEISKLTREHVTKFRRRMIEAPVKVGKSGAVRARSKDTVNRDMATVRAALNNALADGQSTSDFAWRIPLAAFKNVTKRRELYLDRTQRKSFIEMAPPDLAQFIRGLSLLPLRPGALASLRVTDFDARFDILRTGKDKSGGDRKFKVPPEIADFFKKAAAGRPTSAPLLAREDGTPWNKDAWKDPLKVAARKAGLPPETVAYSLRHSVITDLVHGGLDLLTVAQISGTSVAMIEKYYGHLRGEVAVGALAKLVL